MVTLEKTGVWKTDGTDIDNKVPIDNAYDFDTCGFIEGSNAKVWSGTIGGEEFYEL